jgi:hypothetical protein
VAIAQHRNGINASEAARNAYDSDRTKILIGAAVPLISLIWVARRTPRGISRVVGLVAFAALLFLTESVWKASLIGIFVLVSCLLDFYRGWLLRGSFAIAVIAIAVALGAPSPDRWMPSVKGAWQTFLTPSAAGQHETMLR